MNWALLLLKISAFAVAQALLAYIAFYYTTKPMRSAPQRRRARIGFIAGAFISVVLFALSEYFSQRASDGAMSDVTNQLSGVKTQLQATSSAIQGLQIQNRYLQARLDYALKRPSGKPLSDKQIAMEAKQVARAIRSLYAEYSDKENALIMGSMEQPRPVSSQDQTKAFWEENEVREKLDNSYKLRLENQYLGHASFLIDEMSARLPPQPPKPPGPCTGPVSENAWPWAAECLPDELESLAQQLYYTP